jgi:hypothetical protein
MFAITMLTIYLDKAETALCHINFGLFLANEKHSLDKIEFWTKLIFKQIHPAINGMGQSG